MRRTPCGVRGLKCGTGQDIHGRYPSHPVWGAWIEIAHLSSVKLVNASHPVWGAWIEIALLLR